jgi:hypothetical protein
MMIGPRKGGKPDNGSVEERWAGPGCCCLVSFSHSVTPRSLRSSTGFLEPFSPMNAFGNRGAE